MKKTFGIIGAGNIGKAVAAHLLKAGYEVTISNQSGPESLKETVDNLGAGLRAASVEDTLSADIIVLALPWSAIPGLGQLADWNGKTVIDATNHFITYYPDFDVADLGGKASSEVVSELLPGARIVKAFNTLYFKILEQDPKANSGSRVLFVSGDDQAAKAEVMGVIEDIGFSALDLGSLAHGSKLQQAKGSLATLNLIKLG